MHDAELAQMEAHIHSLGDRLSDTARYLKGIAAIVESMNRGTTERLNVAIHAVEAVAEDLSGIHAVLALEGGRLPGALHIDRALMGESLEPEHAVVTPRAALVDAAEGQVIFQVMREEPVDRHAAG